jgi:hypothetical protein
MAYVANLHKSDHFHAFAAIEPLFIFKYKCFYSYFDRIKSSGVWAQFILPNIVPFFAPERAIFDLQLF